MFFAKSGTKEFDHLETGRKLKEIKMGESQNTTGIMYVATGKKYIEMAIKSAQSVRKYNPDIKILKILSSLKTSIEWLTNHVNEVDLIFLDIQLQDGLSFEIWNYDLFALLTIIIPQTRWIVIK